MTQAPQIDRKAYEAKLQKAVIEAVMFSSIMDLDGQRTSVVLSDIVTDVLTMQIAVVIAGTPDCASPTSTRATCDRIAKRLRRLINQVKQEGTVFDRRIAVEEA